MRTEHAPKVGLRLVHTVFFVSGMCALLFQLVWLRLLLLTYGAGPHATTAIVGALMVGLGLGSLAGGEVARRFPDRILLLFAAAEAGVGLYGLVSMPLIAVVGSATAGIDAFSAGVVCFSMLVVPTMLMGATLPLMVTHVVKEQHDVGHAVGDLYHVNRLGGALVCILASFFLFRFFGLSGVVYIAAAGNFGVAVMIFVLGRQR